MCCLWDTSCIPVYFYCFIAEEREEARRNVAAMRRIQSMYMPEPKGDALVDEKQKVRNECIKLR